MIHQDSHAADAYDKRKTEADRQSLRSQEHDFQQRNENRNRCQDHGCNPGGYTLLGPKQASIIDNENQCSEEEGTRPLSAAGSWRALETHPAIKRETGYEKTNSSEKKRRDFVDSYANREKR